MTYPEQQRSWLLPELPFAIPTLWDRREVPTDESRTVSTESPFTKLAHSTDDIADGEDPDSPTDSASIPLVVHPIDDLDNIALFKAELPFLVRHKWIDRSNPRRSSTGRHGRRSRFPSRKRSWFVADLCELGVGLAGGPGMTWDGLRRRRRACSASTCAAGVWSDGLGGSITSPLVLLGEFQDSLELGFLFPSTLGDLAQRVYQALRSGHLAKPSNIPHPRTLALQVPRVGRLQVKEKANPVCNENSSHLKAKSASCSLLVFRLSMSSPNTPSDSPPLRPFHQVCTYPVAFVLT